MDKIIDSIKVVGFRALSELTVRELGRVNLITGKNSAGKTSFLEALWILGTGGSISTIRAILENREEVGPSNSGSRDRTAADPSAWMSLFTRISKKDSVGTPELEGFLKIQAGGVVPNRISEMSVRLTSVVTRTDPTTGEVFRDHMTSPLFEDVDAFPAFEIKTEYQTRVIALERLGRALPYRLEKVHGTSACEFLDPYSSRSTSHMATLWDQIALTDVESEVVSGLQIIAPDIEDVSMVGLPESRHRFAIAKSRHSAVPVPLKTYGDGTNRLFGIILSLCNARGGLLLIDEIENGLHYSVQVPVWKTIFRLAQSLDVQVFVSTHSWDAVRAFQLAASDSPENGVLIRLDRREDGVAATTFSEDELRIVTRDEIEVR